MEVEPAGYGGLYIGIDPPLRHGQSWRIYRCLCLAWADINRAYLESLPGGQKRWFERMNLATKHEGPHSLSPDPQNILYIQRYWRIINQSR
jgi:hypothetical protein